MRTPEELIQAVDKEDVLHNDLYRQGRIQPGTTWCNLFASRVMANLGVLLPFEIKPSVFLRVNEQAKWLRSLATNEGRSHGWRTCLDAPEAYDRANRGLPVVAIWEGPDDSHGHIVVLLPSFVLGAGKEGQIACAQAGRTNFPRGRLAQGFDSLPVRFYTNE